jgi:hypothetical protein
LSPGDASAEALREIVREVLRDVLPSLAAPLAAPPRPSLGTYVSMPAALPRRTLGTYVSTPGAPAVPPTSVPRSEPASAMPPAPHRAGGSEAGSGAAFGLGNGSAGASGRGDNGSGVEPVRLLSDEDLHAFVLRVVALADNPKRRRDLLTGRLRFTLDGVPAAAGHSPAAGAGPGDHRIEKGAVTERAVQAAARAGARLVLGPRAVLTPLARDRARALGVPIEKER